MEVEQPNQEQDGDAAEVVFAAESVVAGMEVPLQALRELLLWPVLYAEEARTLGLRWPKGLLLYGPPGTGKTSLVHAMARECKAHFTSLSGASVHRAYAGESERILREAFANAASEAATGRPAIIFIDEVDTICPPRDSRRQQETRLVAQLLTLMDGIVSSRGSSSNPSRVVVVAATNRVNAIDPALRRPGRFDREIAVAPPSIQGRYEILCLHSRKLPLDKSVDLHAVAAMCNGYVGADIQALCREAAMSALQNSLQCKGEEHLKSVGMEDWQEAHRKVGPSIVRGAAAEIPQVSWEDIGGLHEVKKRLQQAVEWPIKHADAFTRLGLRPSRGVLLHGPPGCCKTTLAKAAAHAAQATLLSLSGAELYSMYVGEGEALLRDTFRRARLSAPSIIFFDEADAIAARRGVGEGGGARGSSENDTSVGEKLLSTLLTEIDGLELAQGVLVLAATNRPQAIDAALMRPGRFDSVLYVPPPDFESRLEVLHVHTRHMQLSDDVDLEEVAENTECFTGAELAGLCREAAIAALRESLEADTVCKRHFSSARNGIQPTLTPLQIAGYANFRTKRLT
ncbi:unnamed protein product [Sphagnum troendelagicum]|uniref:AAA+ ATPase domain-containing protein n=1 Tax=Sphagnum troendelagicum TaxID=128251 RepID=A0ABP0UUI7_9BRYO